MGQRVEDGLRLGVTGAGRRGDVLAADGLGVAAGQGDGRVEPAAAGGVARQPAEPGARREPLPAAPLAARAGRAVGVDDHVAGLAGEAVGAAQQPPPVMMPGADAGAERDHEGLGRRPRRAAHQLGRPRGSWRRCRRRVGTPERSARSRASGTSCMRRRCGPMCSVPARSTRPGHAHADRRRAPGPSEPTSSSSVSTRPVAAVGRGDAALGDDRVGSGGVDGDAEHLGAADVEPDRDHAASYAPRRGCR